jgi:hypothetical protein
MPSCHPFQHVPIANLAQTFGCGRLLRLRNVLWEALHLMRKESVILLCAWRAQKSCRFGVRHHNTEDIREGIPFYARGRGAVLAPRCVRAPAQTFLLGWFACLKAFRTQVHRPFPVIRDLAQMICDLTPVADVTQFDSCPGHIQRRWVVLRRWSAARDQ